MKKTKKQTKTTKNKTKKTNTTKTNNTTKMNNTKNNSDIIMFVVRAPIILTIIISGI